MKIEIPAKERRALRIAEALLRDPAVGRRLLAVRALADGVPVARVARAVRASRPTVYRWAGVYRAEGLAGLIGLRPGSAKERR